MSVYKRDTSVEIDNVTFSNKGSKYYSPKPQAAELISQLDLTSIRSSKSSSSKSNSSKSNSSKSSSAKSSSSKKVFSSSSELSFIKDKSPDKKEEDEEEDEEDIDEYTFECELFIKIITEVFERSEIVDASIYGLFTDINSDMGTPIAIANIGNITNDKDMTCAIIEYDADEKKIYIQQIARCSDSEISSMDKRGEQGSGLHIISKMKQVYFEFKEELDKDIEMIIGSDEALILIPIGERRKNFKISLSWLTLFSSGQTWYNKQGFREPNFDLNTEAVSEFIVEPIISVVKSEKCIDDLIRYGLLKDREDDSEIVKSVFTVVLKRLKIISFETNNSKSGIATDDAIAEMNAYNELLNQSKLTFTKEAPRGFYMKFKELVFIEDSGLGVGLRRGKKRGSRKKRKVNKKKKRSSSKKKK